MRGLAIWMSTLGPSGSPPTERGPFRPSPKSAAYQTSAVYSVRPLSWPYRVHHTGCYCLAMLSAMGVQHEREALVSGMSLQPRNDPFRSPPGRRTLSVPDGPLFILKERGRLPLLWPPPVVPLPLDIHLLASHLTVVQPANSIFCDLFHT